MDKDLTGKVAALAEPVVQNMGLELFDVEYVKEGDYWYLRIYIDKEKGVDLDDCTQVSLALSDILDTKNLISQSYLLEVSSPGLERPLRDRTDFLKYQGSLVSIETLEKIEGFMKFTGYLTEVNDQGMLLTYENNQIFISWPAVEKAHLAVEF
ncbi:MAG: ribosome maturation factor RimP [Peptococcaceae bacterium]|nr:ribosome maturation factor RimP [Peptococcaceae bacterium]